MLCISRWTKPRSYRDRLQSARGAEHNYYVTFSVGFKLAKSVRQCSFEAFSVLISYWNAIGAS